MPSSYTCLRYHLIFSTKKRREFITEDLQNRLYDYIGGIVDQERGRLLAAGGMPDHVHLLTSFPSIKAVADLLRVIKSNSSKWIHETFSNQRDFGWQMDTERSPSVHRPLETSRITLPARPCTIDAFRSRRNSSSFCEDMRLNSTSDICGIDDLSPRWRWGTDASVPGACAPGYCLTPHWGWLPSLAAGVTAEVRTC